MTVSQLQPGSPTRQRGTTASLAGAAGYASGGEARSVPGTALGFGLFVLANAVLFVRPSDAIPALEGVEFYRWLLIACLAVSFPAVLNYLGKAPLSSRPIDLCVFALFPFLCLSSLAANGFDAALEIGIVFSKIIVYYLLLVSLVTTPRRMRALIGWLILFSAVVTILAALDFYKVITLPRVVGETGRVDAFDPNRMYGPGIFQDPNDICVLITTCMILLFGRLADRRGGAVRWLWLLPLAVFVFGFYLTRSRGGMLAFLGGVAIAVRVRYGWQRAILLGVLALPLLALMGGRQLEISHTTHTGQERIQLWNEGLVMFRASPIFGVGPEGFREKAGHVAHNSYMQAFSELGFAGGMFFLGAVVLAVVGLYRLRACAVTPPLPPPRSGEGNRNVFPPLSASGRGQGGGVLAPQFVDADLHQMYPYLLGAVTGYAAGMVTLSLNMLVVTYTFLGLAGVFLAMASTRPSVTRDRFDAALLLRLAGLGLLFLVGMFVFVRLTFQG
jgi:O-antigen ligase